ncbi:MBL fold metallo-hydrolase [Streptomyces sp. NBC_00878]|uniref:MBL fold metallo-hydrolase n=1 Tax=Streptomyces sp. NBC_00878 TaxID=2975854 RepID=UPI0022561752|nr:MBL fold metallo-hydrolase [Streptomyces sp. NBC_00878]MCX4906895.1 MBL fold metallo-hydrolase [Streptomyces sp. NBC_00878]
MTVEHAGVEPRLDEVADGVFAYVQPDGGWCLNNAGLIVSGRHAALVDTAATEARTRALRGAVLAAAQAPPRVVVNTHAHGDHTFGNFVFPEAVVVGHERTREEMATVGLHLTGLWPEVSWGAVEVVLPDITYRDRMTLHIGGTTAELLHPGPAHTTNDTVVWLPRERVLFTGDLVMSGVTPFCPMGSVAGSLRALAVLRSLGAHTVIPGHGPVRGPEVLDAAEGYLQLVRRLAREGTAAGITPLQAARAADLGPYGEWVDAERLVPNLHRAYAEERGQAVGDPADMPALFAEMVEFHGGRPVCQA